MEGGGVGYASEKVVIAAGAVGGGLEISRMLRVGRCRDDEMESCFRWADGGGSGNDEKGFAMCNMSDSGLGSV